MQNVEPPLIFNSKSQGAQNQGFSEKNPNCRDPMPLSVPRLKILRLCWQHTSAHHCDQILLIKMSCVQNNGQSLMLRVVAILGVFCLQFCFHHSHHHHGHAIAGKVNSPKVCFSHKSCSWLGQLGHNYKNNLASGHHHHPLK